MEVAKNSNKHWYAVATKPKHEFKVFEKLQSFNIESFLPTIEKLRQWKDRKKLVTFPLFLNYVFVHVCPSYEYFLPVLKVNGVTKFLGTIPGAPETIPDVQINSLQKLLSNKGSIDIYPYLKVGNKVTLKKGPFAGIEGVLLKKDLCQHVLIVSIDLLNQAVSLKIDASSVDSL